jgi:hypothetical protein
MTILKHHWLTLAGCCVLGFSSTTFGALSCGSADLENCFVNDSYVRNGATVAAGVYKASWEVIYGNINVNIQAETTGWVAIGFHESAAPPAMDDTDFVMGGYSGGNYGGDYFYSNTGAGCPNCAPTLDAVQNISNVVATEAGGVTSFSFSRALKTGDATGDYDLSQGLYDIVWAFRRPGATGDDLNGYHNGGRGLLKQGVNFVPVPTAAWLFGSGLLAVFGAVRRKSTPSSVVN